MLQVGFNDEVEAEEVQSTRAKGVVLDNWRHAKNELSEAQLKEKEARSNVMAYIKEEIKDGTNCFKTNHYTLKVAHSQKYSVAKDDLQALNGALQAIANICGNETAGQLLSWSPSLNKRVYHTLPAEAKAVIDPFLTLIYTDTFSIEE